MLEIAVADTGIGIRAEDLSRLFQTFTQLESPMVKSHGGTGIGLALTKKLIELHGGTITATSPGAGHGSTFTVRLPFVPEGVARPVSSKQKAVGSKDIEDIAECGLQSEEMRGRFGW